MNFELDSDTLDALRNRALDVARDAGACIVEIYGKDGANVDEIDVEMKPDSTPLTVADMAAHRLILDSLAALDPLLPVISEESDVIPLSERLDWPAYWLVDPLDGTREFLRRNGEFTVNIALVVDHRPVLGVIVAPVLDVAYHAVLGHGAWKVQGDGESEPIHVRSVPVAGVTVARSRCPVTGARLQHFLDGLGSYNEIAMGAALKSCLVAEGRADIYARLGPTGEWDTGAAQIIVEEAGGHVTDTRCESLRYNLRESLINPDFIVFGDQRVDWMNHLATPRAAVS